MIDRGDEPENLEQNSSDEEGEPEIAEIVEALPEEVKDELARRIVGMRMEAYSYRAPVPPPPSYRGTKTWCMVAQSRSWTTRMGRPYTGKD